MKWLSLLIVMIPLSGAANDTSVTLKEYIERIMQVQEQQDIQQRQEDRLAIENALLAEIRIQSEEAKSRFALKIEVGELRDRNASLEGRISQLEGSKINTYVALFFVGLLGVGNLIRLFWGQHKE